MRSLETSAAVLPTAGHMERRIASRMFLGQLVSSAFLVSLFKVFPGLDGVGELVYFGGFRWRQDLPAVVQTPPSCQWVIQSSQSPPLFQTRFSFSSADNIQSFFFQSLRSRNFAILDPSRSSLQSHVGDLSRPSAVSCFLHSSSPVSTLYVLRRRSPLPRTTKYVLRLGPFFLPNRSGIKFIGSSNRMRDLASIRPRKESFSFWID